MTSFCDSPGESCSWATGCSDLLQPQLLSRNEKKLALVAMQRAQGVLAGAVLLLGLTQPSTSFSPAALPSPVLAPHIRCAGRAERRPFARGHKGKVPICSHMLVGCRLRRPVPDSDGRRRSRVSHRSRNDPDLDGRGWARRLHSSRRRFAGWRQEVTHAVHCGM